MALLSFQKPVVAALRKHFARRAEVEFNGLRIHPPIVVNASVSSGKSVMICELAKAVKDAALSKRTPSRVQVLVIQRQSELAQQNAEAGWSIALNNSIYSAGLGRKSTSYDVVYATEGTLARALTEYRFSPYTPEELSLSPEQRARLKKFHPDLILIDECHQLPYDATESQYMQIMMHFYAIKSHVRVAGFTGSPFRGAESIIGDTKHHFWRSVACISPDDPDYPVGGVGDGIISTEFMIQQGWVVPPHFGYPDNSEKQYDFSHITPKDWGYDEAELDEATSDLEKLLAICSDMIEKANDRKGVLIFAATQRHARQIDGALKALGVPSEQIGVITERTNAKERMRMLEQAKTGEIKYTINVAVLTTGVNVPRWDTLVFMRPIGSLVLLIQAIGRVLRLMIEDGDVPMVERDKLTAEERLALILASKKPDSLVLDYADVMNTLGHLYENPVLEQADFERAKKENVDMITCMDCGQLNSPRARRCIGVHNDQRCEYFFVFRECPHCQTKNDTTARECRNQECRRILIDPNEKLNHKHYTDAESITVRAMKASAGSGGKLIFSYDLADGRKPREIFYPHAGNNKKVNNILWAKFVDQLPIAVHDKRRLKAMKAETVMQNVDLIPIPVEVSAREKDGKWTVGRRKYQALEVVE